MAYSEFELIECREIIKDQKSQLTCLQRLVDAAVKEKQMIPPTLVIDAASLPQASRPIPIANEAAPVGPTLPQELEERLSHLSSMVSRVSSRLQEGADTSNVVNHLVSVFKDLRTKLDEKMVSTSRGSAEPGGDFVSLDANHVKLMVASDTIPAGGLSLLQFTKSYLDSTRGRVESTMHPRVLTVGSKYFTIREDGDNRLVLYKFHQWDCAAVWDEMEGQIVLRCKAGGDASSAECHVLNFGSADQFQRGFYALQYAGVIPANQTPGEYRDVASNDYAFSVVLMAPQLCPQLEGSRFATADCTLESLRGQLVIKIYNGQTVCHVDPSECILQCDSRSQCYKLWVPEPCAREICGGAPDDGDSNELIPLTCVFVKPSQGYPHYLPEVSRLNWKDVVLSDEIYPALISKLLGPVRPKSLPGPENLLKRQKSGSQGSPDAGRGKSVIMSTATLDMGGPKRLGSSVPDAPARMGSAKTGDGIPQQPLLSNDLTIKDPEVLSQGKSAAGAAAPGAGLPTGPGTSMTRPGPVVGPGSSMPGPGVPMTGPGAASMPAPALSFTGPGAASIAGRGAASMPGPTVSFTGPEQASMAGPGASVADPGAAVADPGAAVRSPETKQAGEAPGLNREESKLSLPPSTSIKEAHDEIGTRSRSFAKNATQPSDRQSIILPAVPGNQDLLRVESGRLTVMANASQVLCTLESAAYGVVADSQNLTLTLVLRENESPVHWYSFRILDRAAFESKCASLFSSGFTTDSGTGLETDGPSYAVAEAGSMALRGFAMQPAQTSVVTDAGRREIVVAEQLPERRVRKIKLACSEREFADWMRAFTWGGFTVDGKPRQALANPALGRFVFRIPVAVAAAKTTARFSKDGRLALFTNVDDPRPVFVIDKINSEVVADPSRQLLRCRLQPETAQAALVELTFSDQKAFDRVVDGASKNKLLKREFRQLPTAFTNKRMPVAMFRQNGFQLWPTARAYNEDEAPFVILFNRLFGAKLNEKEREVVFVPLAHVHPSLDDLAEIVKGFEFKLSATNLDYPRLVFGVVNIGMAGRRDADRPCTAAATFEFHGAARYAVHNQSVPMEGKVDYALLKRVSEANSRGMKIFASSGKKAAAKGAKGATKGGGSGRNRDSGGDNRASDRSPASSVPAKKVSAAAAPVSKKKASAKAAKGKPKPKPKTKKPKW